MYGTIIKKSFCTFFGLFIMQVFVFEQQAFLDSLVQKLRAANKEDTSSVIALSSIATYYAFVQFESCPFYARQRQMIFQKK